MSAPTPRPKVSLKLFSNDQKLLASRGTDQPSKKKTGGGMLAVPGSPAPTAGGGGGVRLRLVRKSVSTPTSPRGNAASRRDPVSHMELQTRFENQLKAEIIRCKAELDVLNLQPDLPAEQVAVLEAKISQKETLLSQQMLKAELIRCKAELDVLNLQPDPPAEQVAVLEAKISQKETLLSQQMAQSYQSLQPPFHRPTSTSYSPEPASLSAPSHSRSRTSMFLSSATTTPMSLSPASSARARHQLPTRTLTAVPASASSSRSSPTSSYRMPTRVSTSLMTPPMRRDSSKSSVTLSLSRVRVQTRKAGLSAASASPTAAYRGSTGNLGPRPRDYKRGSVSNHLPRPGGAFGGGGGHTRSHSAMPVQQRDAIISPGRHRARMVGAVSPPSGGASANGPSATDPLGIPPPPLEEGVPPPPVEHSPRTFDRRSTSTPMGASQSHTNYSPTAIGGTQPPPPPHSPEESPHARGSGSFQFPANVSRHGPADYEPSMSHTVRVTPVDESPKATNVAASPSASNSSNSHKTFENNPEKATLEKSADESESDTKRRSSIDNDREFMDFTAALEATEREKRGPDQGPEAAIAASMAIASHLEKYKQRTLKEVDEKNQSVDGESKDGGDAKDDEVSQSNAADDEDVYGTTPGVLTDDESDDEYYNEGISLREAHQKRLEKEKEMKAKAEAAKAAASSSTPKGDTGSTKTPDTSQSKNGGSTDASSKKDESSKKSKKKMWGGGSKKSGGGLFSGRGRNRNKESKKKTRAPSCPPPRSTPTLQNSAEATSPASKGRPSTPPRSGAAKGRPTTPQGSSASRGRSDAPPRVNPGGLSLAMLSESVANQAKERSSKLYPALSRSNSPRGSPATTPSASATEVSIGGLHSDGVVQKPPHFFRSSSSSAARSPQPPIVEAADFEVTLSTQKPPLNRPHSDGLGHTPPIYEPEHSETFYAPEPEEHSSVYPSLANSSMLRPPSRDNGSPEASISIGGGGEPPVVPPSMPVLSSFTPPAPSPLFNVPAPPPPDDLQASSKAFDVPPPPVQDQYQGPKPASRESSFAEAPPASPPAIRGVPLDFPPPPSAATESHSPRVHVPPPPVMTGADRTEATELSLPRAPFGGSRSVPSSPFSDYSDNSGNPNPMTPLQHMVTTARSDSLGALAASAAAAAGPLNPMSSAPINGTNCGDGTDTEPDTTDSDTEPMSPSSMTMSPPLSSAPPAFLAREKKTYIPKHSPYMGAQKRRRRGNKGGRADPLRRKAATLFSPLSLNDSVR